MCVASIPRKQLESTIIMSSRRIAIVTGANKGIGLEVCKQLATNGIFTVLTARDVGRGFQAVDMLRTLGLRDVIFHQLDVLDPSSIASLVDFLTEEFGRVDILVNNAGVLGGKRVGPLNKALSEEDVTGTNVKAQREIFEQTYDMAEYCLRTNYYAIKQLTTAILPLLQLSNLPKIVNVSSTLGSLKNIPNKKLQEELGGVNATLTEETVDNVVGKFREDMKEDKIDAGGWPPILSAYIVSKAALNAYTRVMAEKYPEIAINAACPGHTKTDFTGNTGELTVEEGAKCPVTVALLSKGGPSGAFFSRGEVTMF